MDWKLGLLAIASVMVLFVLWIGDIIKPGSLKRSGLRHVEVYFFGIWLFAAIVTFVVGPLTAQFAAHWPQVVGDGDAESLRHQTAMLLCVSGVSGAVGIGLAYLISCGGKGTGLRVTWSDIPLGLACFVLALPLVELVGSTLMLVHTQLSGVKPDELGHPTLALILDGWGSTWGWALVAAVVLVVPIAEELIFRGFLQSAILRYADSPWVAVTLTSIGFAAVHYGWDGQPGVPWYGIGQLFMLSIAIGIAYERTRRLGVPIVMHAAFNAMMVTLAVARTG